MLVKISFDKKNIHKCTLYKVKAIDFMNYFFKNFKIK